MNKFSQEKQSSLLKLLEEEMAVFEQIRELTEKQTDLLAVDDAEALDETLDRRQELIEKIKGLHQESDVLMQSYISFSKAAGGGKDVKIETAAEKLRQVITECAELNERNMASAKETAEEYIKRIGKLSLSRKSFGAYAPQMPNSSELFDKKT